MAKVTAQFVCQACGSNFSKWSGRCLSCGAWDSLVEVTQGSMATTKLPTKLKTERLNNVEGKKFDRLSTGFVEVDNVLGGGFVAGSLVLLSGDPGIGKSTLVLQIATNLATTKKVLYVSGEESSYQIKLRAERMFGQTAKLNFAFLSTTDTDQVLAQAQDGEFDLIIVDSIQTMASNRLSAAAGTISQITNNTNQILQTAKSTHTTFLLIGHVTKEGNLAGPRLLEHLVDTVLYLQGERFGQLKILRSVKNRFGSTNEVGVLEMTEKGLVEISDPSGVLLGERQDLPGSVIYAAIEGRRPILVEVQALVAPSVFGYPKRTAAGVDLNRLNVLAAVMTKRANVNLSSSDIYVNIVGGIKVGEPAIDLAIILAIASAYYNQPLPKNMVVFGEVGLSGEVRSVAMSDRRLTEAKKLGFNTAIVPPGVSATGLTKVKTIAQAINKIK